MAITTAVVLVFDGYSNTDLRDMIGIQSGQGAKPATTSDVGMTKFLQLIGGISTGDSGGASVGVVPDTLTAPTDSVIYDVGMPASGTGTLLLTAAIPSMTAADAMDIFRCEVGGGAEQPRDMTLAATALNFLQNLGKGLSGQIILSQGLLAHNPDQWTINAG